MIASLLSTSGLESALVLAIGTGLITAVAGLAAAWARSAAWSRTAWQVGVLATFSLLAVELTGMGTAMVELARTRQDVGAAAGKTQPRPQPDEGSPLGASGQDASCLAEFPAVRQDRGPEFLLGETWDVTTREEAIDVLPSSIDSFRHPIAPPVQARPATESTVVAPLEMEAFRRLLEPTGENVAAPGGKPVESAARSLDTTGGVASTASAMAIWALVTAALLARIAWTQARLVRFRGSCRDVRQPDLRRLVDRLARALGLHWPVCLLESARLGSPVAFGAWRPTVVVSDTFQERFDRSQREAMLAHELAHLAARDPGWRLLANLLCAALWWNPLVFLLRRGLRTSSETAADEASLLAHGGPHALAAGLVALGRQLARGRRGVGWLGVEGSGFHSCLGKRVQRLLSLSSQAWRPPCRWRSGAVKTVVPWMLVFVTVFGTVWVRSQTPLSEGETPMNVLTASWRRSLAAAALTACLLPLAGYGEEAAGQEGHGHAPIAVDDSAESLFVDRDDDRKPDDRDRDDREHANREHDDDRHDDRHHRGDGDRHDDDDDAEHLERAERAEAHHRDRRHRERAEARHEEEIHALHRERDELRERAGRVERELHGLRDGQDEEARELRGVMEEIRGRVAHIDRELREGDKPRERHVHPLLAERNALREEAEAIERRFHALGDRKDREAQEIRAKAEHAKAEIHERLAHLDRELGEGERHREHQRPEAGRGIHRLLRELVELHDRRFELSLARHLLDEGQRERAEQLGREMEEVERRFEQVKERTGDVPEELGLEMRRHRLELLRHGAHRLAEADKPDMAERLEHQARELAEQLQGAARERGEHREPEHPQARRGPPGVEPALHELREQMSQMRREMEELRGMVRELLERDRR